MPNCIESCVRNHSLETPQVQEVGRLEKGLPHMRENYEFTFGTIV